MERVFPSSLHISLSRRKLDRWEEATGEAVDEVIFLSRHTADEDDDFLAALCFDQSNGGEDPYAFIQTEHGNLFQDFGSSSGVNLQPEQESSSETACKFNLSLLSVVVLFLALSTCVFFFCCYDIRSRCLRLSDESTSEALAVRRLLGHRLPTDAHKAKKDWYDIVEGIKACLISNSVPARLRLSDESTSEALAVRRLLGHRLPTDAHKAKKDWYDIVEEIPCDSLVLLVISTNLGSQWEEVALPSPIAKPDTLQGDDVDDTSICLLTQPGSLSRWKLSSFPSLVNLKSLSIL
ncbi:hypothetical protein F2Q69_00049037 [Brassica cretica]|uniref:Uncharacterized protein n=1 Tax=Brassica cretica TaxID=69181 RepID=A0A8S9PXV9_BRACR|nr:hypothetical protein F2Q69_00049037 [Brassica cretica]